MRSAALRGSNFANDKSLSRIELAQILFQTMTDKYVQKGLKVCVGLVCFGEKITVNFMPSNKESDISQWRVLLKGPAGTPYEEGYFLVSVEIPTAYPTTGPTLTFVTQIYHCNISNDGSNCAPQLMSERWNQTMTVHKLVLALLSLLTCPLPDSALDTTKAAQFGDNIDIYNQKAREWTAQHAAGTLEQKKQQYQLE
ncbi:hypothetical protein SAMD00019534_023340 [Acytostelium subglobosum LB1]|uniref:hypothetical protein n=1 Tax=Acytostelium subglobosum LB1 TaxID=1410327 RepID=UPI00064521B2|nr:hypothetical protein SAMD00019534_023340 [Acytostelium subglobosum LB1]GAM19159.1 hypothetical protein SAMD00019534_023340 [Acytostelium subglobosum LB1]|eukprot:XP_012757086.1 hypothetical protein SAMD00019534_023340 [Acytostelium subglobosum LB1]